MPDGELIPFPGRDEEEVEGPVLEGEIVGEDVAPPSSVRQVVQVVRVVVQHEHTRTAGRNVAYVGIGAAVVAKRLWDGSHDRPL